MGGLVGKRKYMFVIFITIIIITIIRVNGEKSWSLIEFLKIVHYITILIFFLITSYKSFNYVVFFEFINVCMHM